MGAERIRQEALKMVAEVFGETVEEVERKVKEQEQASYETVRLLSVNDVMIATRDVLVVYLGEASYVIGPAITGMIIHKLFHKEDGEE